MLRRLISKLRRNKITEAEPHSSSQPIYADFFEVMRYDRASDVMPFLIGYRPKPPVVDPTGPEPNFVLLDSEAEVEAFFAALANPIEWEARHVVSLRPLGKWNQAPSSLSTDMPLVAFYYPVDERQGWPFGQVFAYSPEMFTVGAVSVEQTVRGRYQVRQFPPEDREKYIRELCDARAGKSDIVLVGGPVPFSLIDIMNPRPTKEKIQ